MMRTDKDEIARLKLEIKALQGSIAPPSRGLSDAMRDNDRLKQEINKANDLIEKYKFQIASIRSELESSRLQSRILIDDVERLKEENAELKNQEAQNDCINSLKAENKRISEEVAFLASKIERSRSNGY